MSIRPQRRVWRRQAAAAFTAGTLVVLSAVSTTAPSATAATKSTAIPPGTVLNVGDQEQQLQTLLTSSGVLKGAPYKVNFVEFASGPLVDAGLEAGKIDLGSMGDTPAEVAVSDHLPVKAVLTTLGIGADEWLVAQPGINSIAQLRGKKVAYTTGTAEQAFALRALATAGLTQKDVQQVNVTLQELGTVIESGNADASVLSIQYKTDYLQQEPKAKVLASDISVKPPAYGYMLGTTSALDNPAKLAAIEDFARRYIEANGWEKTHQAQFIQDYYVDVEHQTPSQAKTILAAGGLVNFVPVGKKQQNALQGVVKLLVKSDAIPKSFSVAPLYSTRFEGIFNGILNQTLKGKGQAQQG
jgi:sulfonate transport system substrate-binding protein